ncbi:hypothetical protein [Defluviicoccus vanus]|uniref:Uncharacterized protein n=1 Tax=Defluviicoccus vanus TaxID=111831 RepID=A0A7H1N0Z4_9PROT|nr:hypothetical protein [Defluviicoccus vanus]QNT69380.1 hypothetical protein HQ394_08700 [Defluviicoccus vanus]
MGQSLAQPDGQTKASGVTGARQQHTLYPGMNPRMHPLLRLGLIVLVVLVIAVIGVSLMVGFEPPTQHLEQVIPNDRFQR